MCLLDSCMAFRHSWIKELLCLLPEFLHCRTLVGRSSALVGQTGPYTSSPNVSQTACTRIVLMVQLSEAGNSGGRGLEWVESLMGVGLVGSDDRQLCLSPHLL